MLLLLLLLMSAFEGFLTQSSADWEPAPFLQDGETLYACAGDSVELAWRLDPQGSLRTVRDIKFLHQTEANFLKFNFSNPDRIALIDVPENKPEAVLTSQEEKYLGRIEVNDRVMTIRGLGVADSGLYSMVVTGQDRATGAQRVVTSIVTLVVADDIMTTDKGLHISESETAFFNETTGRHHKVLECGRFTYKTQPPFDVAWTVPGRGLTRSTAYRVSNGRFRLVLPLPMRTGSYGCSVTKDNAARACAKQLVQDRISLDATETRFWLQEKDLTRAIDTHSSEMSALKAKQASSLKSLETRQQSELNSLETRMKAKHASELNSLETRMEAKHASELNSTNSRVEVLEQFKVKASRRVSFWATSTSTYDGVIKFSEVQLNDGNGYDKEEGEFKAPHAGLYIFVATLQTYGSENEWFRFNLEVNEQNKLSYYSRFAKGDPYNYAVMPATAVLHLNQGDRVRIRKRGGTGIIYKSYGNSFGGALIAPY